MARSVATGRTWTLPFVIVPFAEPMQPPWPKMVDEEQGLVQADQSHQERFEIEGLEIFSKVFPPKWMARSVAIGRTWRFPCVTEDDVKIQIFYTFSCKQIDINQIRLMMMTKANAIFSYEPLRALLWLKSKTKSL